jgi:hypothetical protein
VDDHLGADHLLEEVDGLYRLVLQLNYLVARVTQDEGRLTQLVPLRKRRISSGRGSRLNVSRVHLLKAVTLEDSSSGSLFAW